MSGFKKSFDKPGDFEAMRDACAWLGARGFSVGRMQGPYPCGILFGNYAISKWRNLSCADRMQLHGRMTGDKRNGPVVVEIFEDAPAMAIDAIKSQVPA